MCHLPVTDGDQQKLISDLDLIFTKEARTLVTQLLLYATLHYSSSQCLTLPHAFAVQNFEEKCNQMTVHCAKLDSSELQ